MKEVKQLKIGLIIATVALGLYVVFSIIALNYIEDLYYENGYIDGWNDGGKEGFKQGVDYSMEELEKAVEEQKKEQQEQYGILDIILGILT